MRKNPHSKILKGKLKEQHLSTVSKSCFFQKYKCYVNNIFTTLSQQIINGRLLLIVIGGEKSNLSGKFKLNPITTYHL